MCIVWYSIVLILKSRLRKQQCVFWWNSLVCNKFRKNWGQERNISSWTHLKPAYKGYIAKRQPSDSTTMHSWSWGRTTPMYNHTGCTKCTMRNKDKTLVVNVVINYFLIRSRQLLPGDAWKILKPIAACWILNYDNIQGFNMTC